MERVMVSVRVVRMVVMVRRLDVMMACGFGAYVNWQLMYWIGR